MKIPVTYKDGEKSIDWTSVLRALAMLGAVVLYAISQEHRFTIIEEQLKSQYQIIQQQADTQRQVADQLRAAQQTMDRLVTLEEFFHGMDPDELTAFNKQKAKRARPRSENLILQGETR